MCRLAIQSWSTVKTRDLADHAPINYVSAHARPARGDLTRPGFFVLSRQRITPVTNSTSGTNPPARSAPA